MNRDWEIDCIEVQDGLKLIRWLMTQDPDGLNRPEYLITIAEEIRDIASAFELRAEKLREGEPKHLTDGMH
jgi:hypothetical protein